MRRIEDKTTNNGLNAELLLVYVQVSTDVEVHRTALSLSGIWRAMAKVVRYNVRLLSISADRGTPP